VTAAPLLAGAPVDLGLMLRATLLMVAAWAGAAALRKGGASAAARHTAWLLCVTALLALPILRWLVPAVQLPILPAEAALPAGFGSPPPFILAPAPGTAGLPDPGLPERGGWEAGILALYALGAVTLLLRLAAGRWILARLWRDAEPAAEDSWEQLLSRLSLDMQLPRPVALRIARGPVMPMTWGTLRPRLLLPAEASAWPPEQRRLVLLHELAHVARRDSLARSAASLACALYWFHPGAWFAARQMRMEQEHAADDRVLTAGGSAEAYARSLLHLARGMGESLQPDMAATMAGTCQLERRLVSITRPARRDPPTRAFVSSSAVLASLATLVASVGVPVRASSAVPGAREAPPSLTPPFGQRVRSAEAEDRSGSAPPSPRAIGENSARAEALNRLVRPAGDAAVAATLRSNPPAPTTDQVVSSDRRPRGPALEAGNAQTQAPAYAQPLPDYGWGLRRADPNLSVGSDTGPSQRDRIRLSNRRPASDEQPVRPKWARFLPQLRSRSGSSLELPLTAEPTVTLSLSTNGP
jgi:beta-lactamase regulating signal transducer with metallopeptidase domain